MIRPKVPCRGCDRRTMTCHGVCMEYKEYVKENQAYAEEGRTVRENYLRFPPRLRAMKNAIDKKNRRK